MLNDGQVVGDEQIGQTVLRLQILQQVHDLRLYRHIERGDWLVANDQLRINRQGAGDADALALAAGKLVRKAAQMIA